MLLMLFRAGMSRRQEWAAAAGRPPHFPATGGRLHRVLPDQWIGGQKGETVCQRLTHEHPVERVSVEEGSMRPKDPWEEVRRTLTQP